MLGEHGDIATDHHGAAIAQPGLYRVGRPFLYAFNSHTVGGVGRDARRIAQRIAATTATREHADERGLALTTA